MDIVCKTETRQNNYIFSGDGLLMNRVEKIRMDDSKTFSEYVISYSFNFKYIWLLQVLVVAHELFRLFCGMQDL